MSKELDLDQLVLIAAGHSAFQLLWAGVELGLYDKLSAKPGRNLEELATALELERQPARILLTGLTALGVIVRSPEGTYRNADIVDTMLVRGKPNCAAPILGWQAHIVYPGMQDFVLSLRTNRNAGLEHFKGTEGTLYERLTHDRILERIFQDAMSALSKQANATLAGVVDFSPYELVVDAGGGDGTNAMAIARAHPSLKAYVFDSASVCEHAEKNIAEAGMSERVGVWSGNFFENAFPPGTDCVTYCHILSIWSMERNRALLARTRDALPRGGAIVIFNMMGRDDDTGPLSTALGSPYFLSIATGEGMLHSWADYEQALADIGFRKIQRIEEGLALDHGILIATK